MKIRSIHITLWDRLSKDISTGKYLSEALILASTNPQYDDRLLIEFSCTELVIQ